jgi:hypothetical protein
MSFSFRDFYVWSKMLSSRTEAGPPVSTLPDAGGRDVRPYQRRITECDQKLQKHLASFSKAILSSSPEAEPKRKRRKPAKNAPQFKLRSELQRITGVDLTRIDGIDVMVAQTLVS